jgi:hypothetical protein
MNIKNQSLTNSECPHPRGEYTSLDLTPFNYERIERNEPFSEKAII